MKYIFSCLFMIMLVLYPCISFAQEIQYDTTPEYIYAHYNKDKVIVNDYRNVMKLTCVHDKYNVYEYHLHIEYNSPNKISLSKGKSLSFKLFNGKHLTVYSINDITYANCISYKEHVKIRYKTFIIYKLTVNELNELLKYKVFEFKQYIDNGLFIRCGVRNIASWEFNEVLLKQFNELEDHISPYKLNKKTKKQNKDKSNYKPDFDVNTLYKEGRISYLEGDSLVKTDENIKFDVQWIQ